MVTLAISESCLLAREAVGKSQASNREAATSAGFAVRKRSNLASHYWMPNLEISEPSISNYENSKKGECQSVACENCFNKCHNLFIVF